MEKYIKPQANVCAFETNNVITTSEVDTPVVTPESLTKKGYSIGTVKNLFK